jgi:8-oxo-dGTP pyrophosphatase MutT (NUDIX family)
VDRRADHTKASAWLPPGGHVELDEDPRLAAVREAREELGLFANFGTHFGYDPLFITIGKTKGYGNHTDISLWYAIRGDSNRKLKYDPAEMRSYKWLSAKQILAMDISQLDPHMHRFIQKMESFEAVHGRR